RAIAKVYSHNAERLLLRRCFLVQHAHVHHDLAGLIFGAALKLDPHPAVAFAGATIAPRHHCIGESEERSSIGALLPQPLHIEIKFAVEHRLEPVARNVAVSVTVDGIAHLHVISRHALRDCPGSATDAEKPAHHFLACADLGKSAVPARIEIDLQRLGMGIEWFLFHGVRFTSLLSRQYARYLLNRKWSCGKAWRGSILSNRAVTEPQRRRNVISGSTLWGGAASDRVLRCSSVTDPWGDMLPPRVLRLARGRNPQPQMPSYCRDRTLTPWRTKRESDSGGHPPSPIYGVTSRSPLQNLRLTQPPLQIAADTAAAITTD